MLYNVEITYRAQFHFDTVEDAKKVHKKLNSDDYYTGDVDDTTVYTSFAGCVEPINDTVDAIEEMGYKVEFHSYELENYDENDVEYLYYFSVENDSK